MAGNARASVLFEQPAQAAETAPGEPGFFRDLNLDQVIASIIASREEYELAGFFYSPLQDAASIRYRHEALRDLLDGDDLRAAVGEFTKRMVSVRRRLKLADELRYRLERDRLFLDAAGAYCRATNALSQQLTSIELGSTAFRALRRHLREYCNAESFSELAAETKRCEDELAEVSYAVEIVGNRVRVGEYEGETDFGVEVEETFSRFRQGAAKDYRSRIRESIGLDHVEAQVLELVAQLRPEPFASLNEFAARFAGFLDPTVVAFDREVQFYLAFLEYMERLKDAGLRFCFPEVSAGEGKVSADDAFDPALAGALATEGEEVVLNSFRLAEPERIIVVTGPNQGGKTTFARTFGTLHHFASLGLPVPARRACLPLADRILTHFDRQEEIANLRGKLEDDLVRIREMLETATAESVLVLNESFASTTLADALLLGTELIERLTARGSLAVYVTFVDELASLNQATVSMVATVDPADPARRTHRVVRQPADGLAYAWAIADKHGLSYEALSDRLSR